MLEGTLGGVSRSFFSYEEEKGGERRREKERKKERVRGQKRLLCSDTDAVKITINIVFRTFL